MFWLVLLAAANPSHVYHVDLSRAVRATPAGKALVADLEQARDAQQGRLRTERERLVSRRGRMPESAYAAQVEALNRRIEAAEARLEQRQDEGLAPILDKMDGLLAAQNSAEKGARTEALADVPILIPRRLCNRTGWLAEAFRGEAKPPAALGACEVRAFAFVRLDEAMQATQSMKDRLRRIQALQSDRQAELDRFRAELSRLSAQARKTNNPKMAREAAAQRRDLDARFVRYQAEVAASERAAAAHVKDALTGAVRTAQRKHPKVLFIRTDGGAPDWSPSCDATRWLVEVVDGQAEVDALPTGCVGRE